jgi:hypothetical protein
LEFCHHANDVVVLLQTRKSLVVSHVVPMPLAYNDQLSQEALTVPFPAGDRL